MAFFIEHFNIIIAFMAFFIEHFPPVGLNGRSYLLPQEYIPLSFFISHFHNTQRAVCLKAFTRKNFSSFMKSRNWIFSKKYKQPTIKIYSLLADVCCVLKQTVPRKTQNLLSCCTHFWFGLSVVVVVAAAAVADPGDRRVQDVSSRLIAGIANSNPSEGMHVRLLCLLCVV